MTAPWDGGELDGLDADSWERQQLIEVLGEVADEGLPKGGGDDYGPWDDQAQLHAAGAALDNTYALDAQRAAEDAEDAAARHRPSTEDRLARGISRISRGTYLPPAQLRGDPAARDPFGRSGAACGGLDDFGRCASRFHQAGCHVITEGSAATSDARAARAWVTTLRNRAPDPGAAGAAQALGLASPSEPDPLSGLGTWDYLLQPEGGGLADPQLHARVLYEMGEGAPPPEPREPRPDLSSIKAAMGL